MSANKMTANYSMFQLNAGDVLRNVNGKKVATFIEEGRHGYWLEITEQLNKKENTTYRQAFSYRQLRNVFPIKVENARYEVKLSDLTESEMLEIQALLAGRNAVINRTK